MQKTEYSFTFRPDNPKIITESEKIDYYHGKIPVPAVRHIEKNIADLKREMREKMWSSFEPGEFNQVAFLEKRTEGGEKAFRGYIQCNPLDLPYVLSRLLVIAKKRMINNKRTEFKYNRGRCFERYDQATNQNIYQDFTYVMSYDSTGIVVLYGITIAEIEEIISELINDPNWKTIEENQKKAVKFLTQTDQKYELRGDVPLTINNSQLHSVSYNSRPGNNEDHLDRDKDNTPTSHPKPQFHAH